MSHLRLVRAGMRKKGCAKAVNLSGQLYIFRPISASIDEAYEDLAVFLKATLDLKHSFFVEIGHGGAPGVRQGGRRVRGRHRVRPRERDGPCGTQAALLRGPPSANQGSDWKVTISKISGLKRAVEGR